MNLTDKGTKTAQLSAPDRIIYADNHLIHGPDDITAYMKGVCYDAAAYMRYLYNAKISFGQLTTISAQNWLPLFNFSKGRKWDAGDVAWLGFQEHPGHVYICVDQAFCRLIFSSGVSGRCAYLFAIKAQAIN